MPNLTGTVKAISLGRQPRPCAVHWWRTAVARETQKRGGGYDLVKLHFLAGLPFKEAAALLEISERTAKRRWAFARSWLQLEMQNLLSAEPPK